MEKKREKKEKKEERAQGSIEDKEMVGDYILINIIGRGAFGVVWRAVHRTAGNWVAIKRVKLSTNKKKKLQLSSLMMEIDLLKSLQHANIVHYIDHLLGEETLNIIMEYIENGSLESLLRKHGRFPESLVAAYMAQVGEGLAYLHSEGVIHRDIKGANILITTRGTAKLADFGVSTKLEDIVNAEDSFAGTPYWMAPEIISMSGATTACDVWSFGCTIIELLTGTPPYGNLPPAASLYRIVQDDHPPLPEGITDALRDLLLLCFQKDVDRRITSAKLMRHPWLRARKAEAAKILEHVNTDSPEKVPEKGRKRKDEYGIEDTFEFEDEPVSPPLRKSGGLKKSPRTKAATAKPAKGKNKVKKEMQATIDSISSVKSLREPTSSFGGKGSLFYLKGLAQDVDTIGSYDPDNSDTIHVLKSPESNGSKNKGSTSKKTEIKKGGKKKESSEDEGGWYSDEEKTGSTNTSTNPRTTVINSSVDSFGSFRFSDDEDEEGDSDTVKKNILKKLTAGGGSSKGSYKPSTHSLLGGFEIDDDDDEDNSSYRRTNGTSVLGMSLSDPMSKYREKNTDSYDDLDFGSAKTLRLPGADNGKMSSSDSDTDADPFGDMFSDTEDQDDIMKIQASEALKTEVTAQLQSLNPALRLPTETVAKYIEKLLETFVKNPQIKPQSFTNTIIIHLLNMLDHYATATDWPILQYILLIINEMIVPTPDVKSTVQVNFCLLGGIPAVTKFAGPNFPKAIRLEAAKFINRMTASIPLCLHMFIACGGLSVMVTLLEPQYKTWAALIKAAIEGIWNIFHLQILPKSDFCHLFAKSGLLSRLSTTLTNVYKEPSAEQHLAKLADIFFYFSQASLDIEVLDSMCNPAVLQSIREVIEVRDGLEVKPSYYLLWLLHVISNLSMHPNARAKLEQQGFIPVLVRFLERREEFTEEELETQETQEGEKSQVTLLKIHSWVLNALFHLCQLDNTRQERVALAGIIPSLVYFIEEGKVYFLKELAIKLFLDMPHASDKVRNLLWRTDSFPVFVRLLEDPLWFVDTLQCLQVWLREEPDLLTKELCKRVDKLVGVFLFSGDYPKAFLKALGPLLAIVQDCPTLAIMMINSKGLVPAILDGLKPTHTQPYIRNQLLMILLFCLLPLKEDAKKLPGKDKLIVAIRNIARTAQGRVKELSSKILAALQ